MNKLLCKIFGHRWRCLMRHVIIREEAWSGSCLSGWRCDRCGEQDHQQWDF